MLFFPEKVERIFSNTRQIRGHDIPVNSILILLLCWLIPFSTLLLPTFDQWGQVCLDERTQSCTICDDENGKSSKFFIYTVGFIIPFMTLGIANLLMYIKVRKMSVRSGIRTSFKRDERKFIRMLGLIFMTFVVCFVPGMLVKLVFDKDYKLPGLHIFSYVLNWCTVWLNPMVYFFFNDKYQAAYKDLKERICSLKKTDESKRKTQYLTPVKVESSTASMPRSAPDAGIKPESQQEEEL